MGSGGPSAVAVAAVAPEVRRGRQWAPILGVCAVVLLAVALHLTAQAGVLFLRPDWTPTSFRQYFAADQLAYMSMVKNAAEGQLQSFEPFTETGSNYYPRLWYSILGLVAGAFGLHPATAWQMGGLVVQGLLVGVLAWVLIRVGRRLWLGLLAPVPFVLGTFSTLRDGNWFTSLESHAVLWGPFGVLFTVNGEAASLSLGGTALLLLASVWLRATGPRVRFWVTVAAAALIGALANVQTYSFLTAVYLAAYVASAWAIAQWRARWYALVAVLFLPVVLLAGPLVSDRTGQLPTLVFGLLPAVPGLVLLLIRSRGRAAVPFVAAGLAAAPQLVATATGIVQQDPFLVYRVASNVDLGVGWFPGVTGGVAVLLPLILILVCGVLRRRPLWVAFPIAAITVWGLLGANDVWGANAEPYRLWIDAYLLIAVTALPVLVSVAGTLLRGDRTDETPGAEAGAGGGPQRAPLRWRRAVVASLASVGAVAAVSAADWVAFLRADAYHQLWSFTGPADTARAEAGEAAGSASGLVLPDPCIQPFILKFNSGVPIATYHLGMAWPEKRDELQALMDTRAAGDVDFEEAEASGTGFLLTDEACDADWDVRYAANLTAVADRTYADAGGQEQRVTLWRIDAP